MASIVFLRFGQIWGTPDDGWRPEADELRDQYNFYRWRDGVETSQCVSADSELICAYGDADDPVVLEPLADEMRKAGGAMPPVDKWSADPAVEQLLWLDRIDDLINAAAFAHAPSLGTLAMRPGHQGRCVLRLDGTERPRRKAMASCEWPAHEYGTAPITEKIVAAARDAASQIFRWVCNDIKDYGAPIEHAALAHVGQHLVSRLYRRYGQTWRRVNDTDGPRIEMRVGSYFGLTDVRTDEDAALAFERWQAGKTCSCRLRHVGDCNPRGVEAMALVRKHTRLTQ